MQVQVLGKLVVHHAPIAAGTHDDQRLPLFSLLTPVFDHVHFKVVLEFSVGHLEIAAGTVDHVNHLVLPLLLGRHSLLCLRKWFFTFFLILLAKLGQSQKFGGLSRISLLHFLVRKFRRVEGFSAIRLTLTSLCRLSLLGRWFRLHA